MINDDCDVINMDIELMNCHTRLMIIADCSFNAYSIGPHLLGTQPTALAQNEVQIFISEGSSIKMQIH